MKRAESLNRWLALGANVGVLIGLILLVYEVRQNADLMRAQISMDRTIGNMQILADLSNGGELVPVDAKLREKVEGFPQAIGWSKHLTAEERRRYELWMILRLIELNNDWFQCTEGLISPELCQRDIRASMRSSLSRFYELGISFTRSDPAFVDVMQEFARESGLPDLGDDGAWP